MDNLKQLLDEGGRLVIEKQNGKMMVITETEIDGKMYQMGLCIQTSEELLRRWNKIIESSLVVLRRTKAKLLKESKV